MDIIHISDTHGYTVKIPKCDVLIHSGDFGGRTSLEELKLFLNWFSNQLANLKIFIGGNHDIVLEKNPIDSLKLIQSYKNKGIIYLKDESYKYKNIIFYGSPYSPSFYRKLWVFNADRGDEITEIWKKIPDNVDILITHTPPYKILDYVPEENKNVGCKDLLNIIKSKLKNLKLHCFGHIHENYGVKVYNKILFSNGAILDNSYNPEVNRIYINFNI